MGCASCNIKILLLLLLLWSLACVCHPLLPPTAPVQGNKEGTLQLPLTPRPAPHCPCRVNEKGTLQLSIDADAIRRILLDFPKVCDQPPPTHTHIHRHTHTHPRQRRIGPAAPSPQTLSADLE